MVLFLFTPLFVFASEVIKVGIYQNDPKVFLNENGNPSGIFVDVLNKVAEDNNWKIDYVYGKWVDHIEALKNGEIDALTDVAFSEKRSRKFRFNKIEVIGSWVQLFTHKDSKIKRFSDLNGKRIGVLEGSVQEKYFDKYIKKTLDLEFEIVTFKDYHSSVKALKAKDVGGIFADRFFYFSKLRGGDIVPSPLVFRPEGLFFAFSKSFDAEKVNAFDKSLSEMKNDPDSAYYQSLYKWLGIRSEDKIPPYVYWLSAVILSVLAFFVLFSFFLRIEIKRKNILVEKSKHDFKRSESKYKELVELAADGILLGSPEGVITEANTRMEQILGKPRDEIIGLHISKIFPKETLKRTPLDFESLKKGRVVINERELIHPDGNTITVEMHTKMMPDGTYQSIYRDITDRKKIMETIAKNQKLESIGILAGGIAHDFNNLLSGVFGYIDLAKLSCGDKPKCMKYTEAAMKSLDRARNLTHQLLTFSKGGAPVIKAEKIESLVQEVVKFALSGSKCSSEFIFESDLRRVLIDKNQISQVVENIVINAQQSMPSGGVVKISVNNCDIPEKGHPVLNGGSYIKISIADSGTGIEQKHIDKIFDPFFTTKQKGSGLGLSASYSIVARHSGYIDVDSVLGEGSVFDIYLPATEMDVSENVKIDESEVLHKGEGKVIVMDDEEIIRSVLSKIFSRMNYEVIGCPDGEKAIDVYLKLREKGEKVKFMVFDLTVPGGMGGIEAVEKLREIDKEVPVFVSSGYSEDPAVSDPQEFGFSASIAKPFNLKELSKLLEKHFS